MFKSVRWRSEKNKINAVFKLSFHATQVLQFGGSRLVLSLVPADTGKPTAKLEKHEIRDNCCYWETPVFEAVKLVQDPKNGKIHDRIYYFIISTGSSKSSIVGEASVNFSEYAETTKASSIALPFKSLNSDVVLHVSIQRMQENVNQRELVEHQIASVKPEDRSLKGHFAKRNSEENTNEKALTNTVPNMVEFIGNERGSIGSDITLSSSDNSSGFDTPQELGLKSNDILADTENAQIAHNEQGEDDSSTDDSTNSQRDALDDSVEKLKSDFLLLSRKADIADLELQTLRKQIVKENKKSQDLLKEVALLKEECERLKDSHTANNKTNHEGNPWDLLEETRQELNHERNLNTNLRLQLRKTQESNSELILAVQDMEQLEELVKQHSDAKDVEKKMMELCSEIEMYRRDKDEVEMQMEQLALDYEILKQENHDLSCKLEQSHLQQQLKLQYECSGCYATIHDLENQVETLESEFQDAMSRIKELEGHIQSLEEEIDKHERVFESDLEAISRAKVEQEQRAIRAEESLRKTRWKTVNAAERIQDEFRRLSTQMNSTFEENEKVRLMNHHLEDLLRQTRDELFQLIAEIKKKDSKMAASLKERIKLVEVNGNEINTAINSVSRNGEVDEDGSDALLKEMACLREEKSFMEAELKEMQERYSDISLKFAEVEGERQRLVMTLRNVKNTKKSS